MSLVVPTIVMVILYTYYHCLDKLLFILYIKYYEAIFSRLFYRKVPVNLYFKRRKQYKYFYMYWSNSACLHTNRIRWYYVNSSHFLKAKVITGINTI
jgi:hypothetical protein